MKSTAVFAALALCPLTAQAAPIALADMTLVQDATMSGTGIELTGLGAYKTGAAWTSGYALSAGTTFTAEFSFTTGGGSGADGLAFAVVRSDTAYGVSGGGIGYFGLAGTLAVEFDTYNNGGTDPNANHIGIAVGGSSSTAATLTPDFDIDSGDLRYAKVSYDGSVLSAVVSTDMVFDETPLTYAVDLFDTLGPVGYFGFTAATGARDNYHTVKSLDLTVSTPAAVPLPAGAPLLLTAFGLAALARRRA